MQNWIFRLKTYIIINVFGWSFAMFQNVVVVSVIDHKNSPGFEQTVKVGNSSSLILLISTKRAKSPAFLFGIPVTFSFKNSLDKVGKILKGSMDLISSPSPLRKIQIMGGKVCLRCEVVAKHCWALSTNFLFSKIC